MKKTYQQPKAKIYSFSEPPLMSGSYGNGVSSNGNSIYMNSIEEGDASEAAARQQRGEW